MKAHQRKARRTAPEAPWGAPALFSLGPRWLAGTGAWEAAAAELCTWPQPIGLVGEAGLLKQFRRPLAAAWLEAGLHLEVLARPDGSDCGRAEIAALLSDARGRGIRSLLGFGGGRMLDLAKAAGFEAGWPVATAPSSAATCACASGVAVLNREGAFSELLDCGPPRLCIVESSVLAQAPKRLLAAGLADTLAKWLEWRALESAPNGFGAGAAWALAQRAATVCVELGAEALALTEGAALDACLEACLLWSALISNAGQAPAAAAHSLANALGRQAQGKGLLHGEAVGLGLLWQEALLGAAPSANIGGALAPLLASWGLPTVLPVGLDLDGLLRDAWRPEETLHLLGLKPDAARDRRCLPPGPLHG